MRDEGALVRALARAPILLCEAARAVGLRGVGFFCELPDAMNVSNHSHTNHGTTKTKKALA